MQENEKQMDELLPGVRFSSLATGTTAPWSPGSTRGKHCVLSETGPTLHWANQLCQLLINCEMLSSDHSAIRALSSLSLLICPRDIFFQFNQLKYFHACFFPLKTPVIHCALLHFPSLLHNLVCSTQANSIRVLLWSNRSWRGQIKGRVWRHFRQTYYRQDKSDHFCCFL